MRREYPDQPLVGVGVLIRDGEKILIVRRAGEPSKGLWSIPGGLVELGERVRDAAVREVREETGLSVEIEDLLGVFDSVTKDESGAVRYHYILVDFLAHSAGGKLKPASDISDARWISPGEVDQYATTRTLGLLMERLRERTPRTITG